MTESKQAELLPHLWIDGPYGPRYHCAICGITRCDDHANYSTCHSWFLEMGKRVSDWSFEEIHKKWQAYTRTHPPAQPSVQVCVGCGHEPFGDGGDVCTFIPEPASGIICGHRCRQYRRIPAQPDAGPREAITCKLWLCTCHSNSTPDERRLSEIRERIAAVVHEQWAGWVQYLFSRTIEVGDKCEEIQADDVKRWRRQMTTQYADLSEHEKDTDRALAQVFVDALLSLSSTHSSGVNQMSKTLSQAFHDEIRRYKDGYGCSRQDLVNELLVAVDQHFRERHQPALCNCENGWLLVDHEAEEHFGDVYFYVLCEQCQ